MISKVVMLFEKFNRLYFDLDLYRGTEVGIASELEIAGWKRL